MGSCEFAEIYFDEIFPDIIQFGEKSSHEKSEPETDQEVILDLPLRLRTGFRHKCRRAVRRIRTLFERKKVR